MIAAAEACAARVDAVEAQRARVGARLPGDAAGPGATTDDRWGVSARLARADPRREPPEPELALLAPHFERTGALVDVGGGSGRLGLAVVTR